MYCIVEGWATSSSEGAGGWIKFFFIQSYNISRARFMSRRTRCPEDIELLFSTHTTLRVSTTVNQNRPQAFLSYGSFIETYRNISRARFMSRNKRCPEDIELLFSTHTTLRVSTTVNQHRPQALYNLMEVLLSIKNIWGVRPIFTVNIVMKPESSTLTVFVCLHQDLRAQKLPC